MIYTFKKYILYIANLNRQYWPLHQDERQPKDITAACPPRFWFLPGWDGVEDSSTSEYKPQLSYCHQVVVLQIHT